MRQARNWFLLLPVFLVLACAGAYAQANAEITGIVTDQTGAVVPGAKIVVSNPATGDSHTTASGGTGLYDVPGLNPGNYDLKATAKGFETFVQKGITVNVSSTVRADVKLTVGAGDVTVSVEADALAVQSDSNVVSSLISGEQITEIATENRNFAALAALGLGVSSTLPDNNTPMAGAGGSSFSISANGLRQSHNIWLIDGGESDDRGGAGGMQVMPPQDSIAEFTALTSNYPPDYGISSGATFSLSIKSGTQKFHGEAYEFNRNTDYNANDFFNKFNGAHSNRQGLDYNIYGFNVGGPLYIPGAYNTNKQKTFFFVNEEWRNLKQASGTNVENTFPLSDYPSASGVTYTPPPFFNNSLSGGAVGGLVVPTQITDPKYNCDGIATACGGKKGLLQQQGLTPGMPFPTNSAGAALIPAALIDSNMAAYVNKGYFPKPVTNNGQSVEAVPAPIKIRDDVVRVDHKINDKWQLLLHYIHENDVDANSHTFLGWDWSSYNTITSSEVSPANSAAIKLSGTITPNLLLEASVNYDGNQIDIDNSANSGIPAGWSVSPFFVNSHTTESPSFAGFGNLGTAEQMGSAPWHNAAQDTEPKADLSYTAGKHSYKFGVSYNRYTKNQQLFGSANGQFALGGNNGSQYSGNTDLKACQGNFSAANPAPSYCVVGDGVIDGLLGLASNYQQQNGQPIRHYVNYTPSIYAMDNWHVTPRLTLQLGVRWDALPQAYERNNFVGNFNPASYQVANGASWNSDGSLNASGPGFVTITPAQSGEPGATQGYYLNGVDLAGVGGTPKQLVTNRYDTWQPRIGFSEDLFGNGKTVLRGGIGTFYERLQGNLIYNSATDSPFAITPSANQVYLSNPHTSLVNGQTATTPTFAAGEYAMATSFPDPSVAMFSLGVQHELAPSVVLVVQYVGNVAWHQSEYINGNNFPVTTDPAVRAKNGSLGSFTNGSGTLVTLPTSGQGNVANNSNSFRTYEGFSGITNMTNNTNGNYNGFQTGLRVQNKWGLSGEIDYTYSHAIDIQSGDNTCCTSNPWNLRYDRGSGSYDRRHILVANYVYKLPLFNKSQGLLKTVAGGWELAGTVTDETGVPLSPGGTQGDPVGLGGGYSNRPNVNGKVHYPHNLRQWFDTTQFSYATPSWLGGGNNGFGNAGKDAIVGPGRVNFTTSLYKSFAITERAHFELRVESFNTFNHTQFSGINTGYGGHATVGAADPTGKNGTYGWANSDWGPRNLEFGGKFVF